MIDEAARTIAQRWGQKPEVAILLGTGMGPLVGNINAAVTIDYEEIPGFHRPTAPGHSGKLVCGHLQGAATIVMQGRWHSYEGRSANEVTHPVRLFRRLGARMLIITNASGGLNPGYASGEVMLIDDHINLMGKKGSEFLSSSGPRSRFSSPYSLGRIEQAQAIARKNDFVAHRGVYAAMTGPNYETRAEYRMLRRLGADVVGMSTVPEAIAAANEGLEVLGISVVTNLFRDDAPHRTTAEEVIYDATLALPSVRAIIEGITESVAELARV